ANFGSQPEAGHRKCLSGVAFDSGIGPGDYCFSPHSAGTVFGPARETEETTDGMGVIGAWCIPGVGDPSTGKPPLQTKAALQSHQPFGPAGPLRFHHIANRVEPANRLASDIHREKRTPYQGS